METPMYWRIYVLAPAPAAHWAASEPPPDLRVQGLRPFKFMDVERKYVRNHLIEINQMLTHFQSCENQSYFIFNQTVTFQIQDLLESLHSDDKPQTEKRKNIQGIFAQTRSVRALFSSSNLSLQPPRCQCWGQICGLRPSDVGCSGALYMFQNIQRWERLPWANPSSCRQTYTQ